MFGWGVVFLCVFAAVSAAAEPINYATFPEVARSRSPSRIVSGWEAEEGQIPFQLSLRMVNSLGTVSSCGGTIIHPEWGMTAAHCTALRVTMVIRAGAVNLTRPEVLFETSEYYNHPNYNDNLQSVVQPDDISLLRFGRRLVYSDRINQVRLQPSFDMNRNYDGVRLIASGWGRTWTDAASPENMNWVYLSGVANVECWISFSGSSIIVDSTICARGYNVSSQSTCQGDSGGPLTVVDEDGEITQVGISSFVSSAGCHVDIPAGFIRPGHYHDWYYQITGINFDWDPIEVTTPTPEVPTTVGPPSTEEPGEIPTTVGPPSTEEPGEIPTTVGPPSTEEPGEIPTTVGPPSTEEPGEIPTTVGPPSTEEPGEIPTTVGPPSTEGPEEIPSTVGPPSTEEPGTTPEVPSTVGPIDPTTSQPETPETVGPIDPSTSQPETPETVGPIDPSTSQPDTPATVGPIDPTTSQPETPETVGPIDPSTSQPDTPATVGPIDPTTSQPETPETVGPIDPTTSQPEIPETVGPIDPTTSQPETPETVGPIDPTTSQPETPETVGPIDPTTSQPETPETVGPVDPTTSQPGTPETVGPIDPTTSQPETPETVGPIDPTTSQPETPETVGPIDPSTPETEPWNLFRRKSIVTLEQGADIEQVGILHFARKFWYW